MNMAPTARAFSTTAASLDAWYGANAESISFRCSAPFSQATVTMLLRISGLSSRMASSVNAEKRARLGPDLAEAPLGEATRRVVVTAVAAIANRMIKNLDGVGVLGFRIADIAGADPADDSDPAVAVNPPKACAGQCSGVRGPGAIP